ncbi:hypothetical protein BDC45DRAFT_516023 [Circinella umbellata]|nr:hypothetical protein BDC45DRAFT_516023 [Circinella umbellata]
MDSTATAVTTTNSKKTSRQAHPSVMLPSSLSRGRVFLSPIPTTTTYNFKATHREGQQYQNTAAHNNTVNTDTNNSNHFDEVEECCLYYYSRVSLAGDEEDENDLDTDTVITKTTSASFADKDDFTVFSTSPPRSLDTVMSPTTTSDSGICSTIVTPDSTTATTVNVITKTTATDEKILPVSPPLSPPLSPITNRPRFPRWIKQISAPSIMGTLSPSTTIVSSPTNNVFTTSPREMTTSSFSLLPLHNNNKKNNNIASTSLLSKPPSLMRRIMMPPLAMQDTKPPPLEISHPSQSAHYHGSIQIREYLHDVMKANRFDEMLLSGFPALCPQHDKKKSLLTTPSYNNVDHCDLDDDNDCESIMTEDDDDFDENIIHKNMSPCLCNHRQMTLRITLTPGHCRATETEIYGHSRPSHHQQRKFQSNAAFAGRNHRLLTSSISAPTPAATRRKHAKDPTPTLSLPPLPRHNSLRQQRQRTAPLYVVTSSQPHYTQSQQSTSPTKSSVYYNSYHQQFHHHQQPILILPNGARRHYLQK